MMNNLINYLLPSVEHLSVAGYWIAFFAALLETIVGIGLVLPGSTVILLLGALAARGYLDLGDLIWFSVLGAILGDNANYFLGRKYGAGWLEKGFWFLKDSHIDKAKYFINAHGAKSVFLGRFIPSIKEIIPFIAGSLGMNSRKFMLWNVLGAIGWGFEWVLAGYFFAQSLSLAQLWLSRAGIVVAFILICILVLSLCKWLLTWKGRQLLEVGASLFLSIKEALARNEHVHQWVRNHPRSISFLQRRFDTSVFSGVPLTILLLTFVYVLGLFLGIVEDLITSDPITAADVRIANLIPSFRTDGLTTVFSWITLLGKSQVVLVFLGTFTVLLWMWRKQHLILALFVSVTGSEAFTYLGKLAFHRSRPEMRVYAEHSFSFPSGHSTIAVAFYGFMAYILIRSVQSWSRKVNILFLTILLIGAIGFSRVYLGEHYVSDVWCGYLVGAMWLIMAITFAEWLKQSERFVRSASPAVGARPVSIVLIGCAVLFYIGFSINYKPPLAQPPTTRTETVQQVSDIFTREQMKHTETLIGTDQEPVNFVFIAPKSDNLVGVLRDAGWTLTDKADISSFAKAIKALITGKSDPSAPISPSFWNEKIEDMSFTKLTGSGSWLDNARHLRIWTTGYTTMNGENIYVAMVNANNGIKWGVIPKIASDMDTQRELLLTELEQTGKIENTTKIQLLQPLIGKNFIGDQFFSDGKAYIVFLKR